MGHQSLETTMRDLVPASDVHDRLDQVGVPSVAKTQILKGNPFNRKSAPAEDPFVSTIDSTEAGSFRWRL
jgi:hypothetical protein